ncbi:MAG: transcription antitermination factor NusB [Campylobacterales bacterium]|nr:transcription antitermination factor NusB [Campylobacterales bacterium]
MATRHQVRESVVGLLYAHDIGNEGIDKFINELFDEKKIRNQQRAFALGLYEGVQANKEAIDKAVNEHLKEWELEKLGTIERAILRLGTYELLFTEVDSAVAINEAIELAKEMGNDTSPKFINGVLDALKKGV